MLDTFMAFRIKKTRITHQQIQWWAWLWRSGHRDSLQAADRQLLVDM